MIPSLAGPPGQLDANEQVALVLTGHAAISTRRGGEQVDPRLRSVKLGEGGAR
jgi:hypothetical protein